MASVPPSEPDRIDPQEPPGVDPVPVEPQPEPPPEEPPPQPDEPFEAPDEFPTPGEGLSACLQAQLSPYEPDRSAP